MRWRRRYEQIRADIAEGRDEWREEMARRREEWREQTARHDDEMARRHEEWREHTARHDEEMRKLHEEIQSALDRAEADRRFGNELLRRHELVTNAVLKELGELRAESRAHTQALFRMLDRFQGGGAAPAS